ncbi:MAG: SIR2 family protein [Planctomycetota bacterium]
MSSSNGHANDIPELDRVCEAIRGGSCIPFLGAGASMGYSFNGIEEPDLPSGWDLTIKFLRETGVADEAGVSLLADPDTVNGHTDLRSAMNILSYDLFKAAEYYLYKKNNRRSELDRLLPYEVKKADGPRPIHAVIAQLTDIQAVLTTNYDCLFEEACETYKRELHLHVHEQFRADTAIWRCPAFLKPPQLLLHKMHGCIKRDNSMIITRADYIRYLRECRTSRS